MQVENVFVNCCFIFVRGKFCCLMLQFVEIVVYQLQVSYWVIDVCVGIYSQVLRFQCFVQGNCFMSVVDNMWRIEVNVGQG